MKLNFIFLSIALCMLIFTNCSPDSTTSDESSANTETGIVTTIAGQTDVTGSFDATGTDATFNYPVGITCDSQNLYVSDSGNYVIRKIQLSTGNVTTIAGTAGSKGTTDGARDIARLLNPAGITVVDGVVYFCDTYAIRKLVLSTGVVSTFAGHPTTYNHVDANGTSARFCDIKGICSDGTNLYVTEKTTIRKIVITTGEVTTLAGTYYPSNDINDGITDGVGSGASFLGANAITTDGVNLYVMDTIAKRIRKIEIATQKVTTPSFLTDNNGYGLLSCDGTDLYVFWRMTLCKVDFSTEELIPIAGKIDTYDNLDGTGENSHFTSPNGMVNLGTTIYVTTDEHTIRKIVQP